MDSFAALALATDPPNDESFDRLPEPRGVSLINHAMWKMIWCQVLFQSTISLVLYFAGPFIPLIKTWDNEYQSTMIFNFFVWAQIFNLFNCRRVDNKLNIFHAIKGNWWFLTLLFIMVGGQVLIVNVGGSAFVVSRLGWQAWLISLILASLCIPWAIFFRLFVPDSWFRFPRWLFFLSWAKLEGDGTTKEFWSQEDGVFGPHLSNDLQERLRGRRFHIITNIFSRRPRHNLAAALVLPAAVAGSVATPADGRSLNSASRHNIREDLDAHNIV